MSTVSNRIEQQVQLRRPDKKIEVVGPRGAETLVLDGKVDDFLKSHSSALPLANLKDAKKLLTSQAVSRLAQANPNRDPNWMFYSQGPTGQTMTLKVVQDGDTQVVTVGHQTIRKDRDSIELISRIPIISSGGFVQHTIHGQPNAKGGYDVTGEDYHTVKSSGNLWGSVANILSEP